MLIEKFGKPKAWKLKNARRSSRPVSESSLIQWAQQSKSTGIDNDRISKVRISMGLVVESSVSDNIRTPKFGNLQYDNQKFCNRRGCFSMSTAFKYSFLIDTSLESIVRLSATRHKTFRNQKVWYLIILCNFQYGNRKLRLSKKSVFESTDVGSSPVFAHVW